VILGGLTGCLGENNDADNHIGDATRQRTETPEKPKTQTKQLSGTPDSSKAATPIGSSADGSPAFPLVAAEPFFFESPAVRRRHSDSEEDTLPDGEYVIGVEVNGRARAYPMSVMSREVGNDTFADEPIAVSW